VVVGAVVRLSLDGRVVVSREGDGRRTLESAESLRPVTRVQSRTRRDQPKSFRIGDTAPGLVARPPLVRRGPAKSRASASGFQV